MYYFHVSGIYFPTVNCKCKSMLTPQKLEPRMTSVSKTRQISARDSQERRPWPVRSKLDKYIYFLIRFTQPKINYLFTSHADPGGKELNKHVLNRNWSYCFAVSYRYNKLHLGYRVNLKSPRPFTKTSIRRVSNSSAWSDDASV